MYAHKRKSWDAKIKKKFENFAVCLIICTRQTKKTNGKSVQLPCVFFSTRQRKMNGGRASFAVCQTAGTRQTKRPQPARMFAVCPTSGTRQRRKRCRVLRFAVFFFTSPRSMKDFYRVSDLYRVYFYGAHGECPLCGVLYIFRVLQFGHTAKALFTMCPRYSTWQSLRHTANTHSP